MDVKVWDDKYVIKSDAYCYILKEIKQRQPKDDDDSVQEVVDNGDGTYEVTVAYPSNLASCFRYIAEAEGRNNKCTTLEGYIKHLEKVNNKLEENVQLIAKMTGATERIQEVMTKIPTKKDG